MSHRTFAGFFASGAVVFLMLAPAPVNGQGPRAAANASTTKAIPRTPDGHSNLEGVWTNSSLTPLERLHEFEGKQSITEAEATAYEKNNLEQGSRDRRDGGADADINLATERPEFDAWKWVRA